MRSQHEGGRDLLPYLGMACGYFGRLNTHTSTATNLFDEISEMYFLAHRESSGHHSRDKFLGLGTPPAINNPPKSPDQYDTSLAEFEPKENADSEFLSLPLVEYPQSPLSTLDNTLDTSHLDDIFFSI